MELHQKINNYREQWCLSEEFKLQYDRFEDLISGKIQEEIHIGTRSCVLGFIMEPYVYLEFLNHVLTRKFKYKELPQDITKLLDETEFSERIKSLILLPTQRRAYD